VRNQINDITDLESKIQTATRDLDHILSQAEERPPPSRAAPTAFRKRR
ncbi:MAG: hypothetical protein HC922_08995, partial [Leptolyngbyaceae cyanobacterium SM2_3_12]|nr:hypothetical protein [Leptolyngbyaceae cyanobacterium SM2_3_12]